MYGFNGNQDKLHTGGVCEVCLLEHSLTPTLQLLTMKSRYRKGGFAMFNTFHQNSIARIVIHPTN